MAAPTIDLTTGEGASAPADTNPSPYFTQIRKVDFSVHALAQNETLALFQAPKGCDVDAVDYEIVTPEGATCLVDCGDQKVSDDSVVDADGYGDDWDFNAAAGTKGTSKTRVLSADATPVFVPAYGAGKTYTSDASEIVLTAKSAGGIGTAVVIFRAHMRMVR